MVNDDPALRDILLKMYQEHCTQGRHHETQRATLLTTVSAISAAVIGIITFNKTIAGIPAALPAALLIALGVFAAVFSMKHYERFNLHMERARRYRDELDKVLLGNLLKNLKSSADTEHEKKFPRLHKWPLHYWWVGVNLVIAVIGIVLFVIAIWFPTPPPR